MMKRLLLFLALTMCLGPLVWAQVNGQLYVVIVNGGRSLLYNHERYWNDCAFLYQTLRHTYHIPKRNITLLMADGDNPSNDLLKANATGFKSSPTDLDNDGEPDLTTAATKQNLAETIRQLAGQMTSSDHLFLYIIDHGEKTADGNAFLWLWNNERLTANELAAMLSPFQVASMNILLGQCYAGAFVGPLMSAGRIITTACAADELSWSCPDRPYDEFVYHWTCAIAKHDEQGNRIEADENGDGHITMDEAFDYARQHNRRSETPQLSQSPASLASQWSFDFITDGEGVKETKLDLSSPFVYDLQGRRLQKDRKEKGLYLERGRKYIKIQEK